MHRILTFCCSDLGPFISFIHFIRVIQMDYHLSLPKNSIFFEHVLDVVMMYRTLFIQAKTLSGMVSGEGLVNILNIAIENRNGNFLPFSQFYDLMYLKIACLHLVDSLLNSYFQFFFSNEKVSHFTFFVFFYWP